MAGGHGTRLWPLSTPKKPKPFLNLIPGTKTLLEETLIRLKPIIPPNRIFLIGNQEHLNLLRKFSSTIPKKQIVGEPVLRNTAATVTLAASLVMKKDPEALLLVLPADHWIGNPARFRNAVKKAVRSCVRGTFCVFGVKATCPSPSYGYLKLGKRISNSVYQLSQFVEKPSVKRASRFLKEGRYFWHAGIFLAQVKMILESVKRFKPILIRQIKKMSIRNGKIHPSKLFSKLPNISFDYAVLERLKDARIVYSDCDWSDVGTWETLADLWANKKS
jgi:mannose-1-phosphate guanylyltransferase